jgi:hypothetical protein
VSRVRVSSAQNAFDTRARHRLLAVVLTHGVRTMKGHYSRNRCVKAVSVGLLPAFKAKMHHPYGRYRSPAQAFFPGSSGEHRESI